MQIRLHDIINSKEALQKLLDEKFPIGITWKIKENLKLIEPKYNTYEELRSQLIIEKYGEEDKKVPGNWSVKPSMMREFTNELDTLRAEMVDIPIVKVKLPSDTKISASSLYLLEWMIDFEEEPVT